MAGPWLTILKNAPAILAAADALLAHSRRRSANVGATNDVPALRKRIAELEEQQRAAADLVKQMADQVTAMTVAAQQTAARARQAYVLAIVGIAAGLVAGLVAWLR